MMGSDRLDDLVLVTLSYAGDLEICRRLCATVDRWIDPAIRHDLIIDRCDLALFEPLVTARRRIVVTEDLLPELRQVTFRGRRFWLNPRTLPVRGWILQQLAKIAHVATLEAEAAIIIDSDAEFIRPIQRDMILRDGRVRLFRTPTAEQPKTHARWHRVASRLLGVDMPAQRHFGADYIAAVVPWSPAVVRALIDRLRKRNVCPWHLLLGRQISFSEYVLYGIFAEKAEGAHRKLLVADPTDLSVSIWNPDDLAASANKEAFVARLKPHHVAVHLQSNLGLDEVHRQKILQKMSGSTPIVKPLKCNTRQGSHLTWRTSPHPEIE